MARNGHEIGCACGACALKLSETREIAPGISSSRMGKVREHRLVLMCGGFASPKRLRCHATIEVPLPITSEEILDTLFAANWIPSAASRLDSPVMVTFPLCPSCARAIHGDAMIAAVKKARHEERGSA